MFNNIFSQSKSAGMGVYDYLSFSFNLVAIGAKLQNVLSRKKGDFKIKKYDAECYFAASDYSLCSMPFQRGDDFRPECGKLYIKKMNNGDLQYTVITPQENQVTDIISVDELQQNENAKLYESFVGVASLDGAKLVRKLKPYLADLLAITAKRGHTAVSSFDEETLIIDGKNELWFYDQNENRMIKMLDYNNETAKNFDASLLESQWGEKLKNKIQSKISKVSNIDINDINAHELNGLLNYVNNSKTYPYIINMGVSIFLYVVSVIALAAGIGLVITGGLGFAIAAAVAAPIAAGVAAITYMGKALSKLDGSAFINAVLYTGFAVGLLLLALLAVFPATAGLFFGLGIAFSAVCIGGLVVHTLYCKRKDIYSGLKKAANVTKQEVIPAVKSFLKEDLPLYLKAAKDKSVRFFKGKIIGAAAVKIKSVQAKTSSFCKKFLLFRRKNVAQKLAEGKDGNANGNMRNMAQQNKGEKKLTSSSTFRRLLGKIMLQRVTPTVAGLSCIELFLRHSHHAPHLIVATLISALGVNCVVPLCGKMRGRMRGKMRFFFNEKKHLNEANVGVKVQGKQTEGNIILMHVDGRADLPDLAQRTENETSRPLLVKRGSEIYFCGHANNYIQLNAGKFDDLAFPSIGQVVGALVNKETLLQIKAEAELTLDKGLDKDKNTCNNLLRVARG